jgi:hypothetical protein
VFAGRSTRHGGFEYGPDDVAAVGCGQNPKCAGEARDHGQPSPVQFGDWMLTRQGRAVVANGQSQRPAVPDEGQINIGAGMY